MQVQPLGNITPRTEPYERQAAPVAAPARTAVSLETRNPVQPTDEAPGVAEVSDAVKTINQTVQALSPSLEFSIDADSKRTIVKVVDTDTKEVIRQMPTQEALDIAKALDRLQGLLIRQKA